MDVSRARKPAPLPDRAGYVSSEKVQTAAKLKNTCSSTCALDVLVKYYCRESGVRTLEKHIQKVPHKVALRVMEDFGEDASLHRCPAYIFIIDGLVRKPVTAQELKPLPFLTRACEHHAGETEGLRAPTGVQEGPDIRARAAAGR
ncbi:hypothetical protein B0H14DRAFT_3470185 [Mycena olivaceomarginata]|nr:hypothetical protein B0H14DRAFT_3470185 [Mycena olivaceomarginata]